MSRRCAIKESQNVQTEVLLGWNDMASALRAKIRETERTLLQLRRGEKFVAARIAAGEEFPIAYPKRQSTQN